MRGVPICGSGWQPEKIRRRVFSFFFCVVYSCGRHSGLFFILQTRNLPVRLWRRKMKTWLSFSSLTFWRKGQKKLLVPFATRCFGCRVAFTRFYWVSENQSRRVGFCFFFVETTSLLNVIRSFTAFAGFYCILLTFSRLDWVSAIDWKGLGDFFLTLGERNRFLNRSRAFYWRLPSFTGFQRMSEQCWERPCWNDGAVKCCLHFYLIDSPGFY